MSRLRRSPVRAFVAACALTALLSHCGDPGATPPAGAGTGRLSGGAAARAHTAAILEFGPRPPGSAALHRTRDYLTTTLRQHGWLVGSQKFTAPTPAGEHTFVNLLARFGAPGDPDTWSRPVTGLIGCHIDSKLMPPPSRFLGADDSASAAGLMLELARQLRDHPAQARQIELVFFDGEEAFARNMTAADGLYGSRKYATRWLAATDKPKFGLVLDMIGHRDLKIRIPADSPPHLAALLTRAAAAEDAAHRFSMAATPILDDHLPLNNAGIPTLDIIGDFSTADWWHTDHDNLSLIAEDSLELSLRIVRRMLDELAPANSP